MENHLLTNQGNIGQSYPLRFFMIKSALSSLLVISLGISAVRAADDIELSKLPVDDAAQAVWLTLDREAIFKFDTTKIPAGVQDDLYFQNGAVLPLSAKPQAGSSYCKLDLQETVESKAANSDISVKSGTNFKVRALEESQAVSGGKAVRLDLASSSILNGAVSVIENLVCISANSEKAVTVSEVTEITGGALRVEYGYIPMAAPPVSGCIDGTIYFYIPVWLTNSSLSSTSSAPAAGGYGYNSNYTNLIGTSAEGSVQIEVLSGSLAHGMLQLSDLTKANMIRGLEATGLKVADSKKICVSDVSLNLGVYQNRIYGGAVSITLKDMGLKYKVNF